MSAADLLQGLRQPDQRSCGPSSLVAARMLLEESYRPADFDAEVLALHASVTSVASARLPWPRALGTPPWAVERQLERWTGDPWRTRVVRFSPEPAVTELTVLYVGNRWLPRHVVLALGDGRYYDPARGTVGPRRSGWPTLWFTVSRSGSRSAR